MAAASARAENRVVLLSSGDACGEPRVSSLTQGVLARRGRSLLPPCVVRGAVVRARSVRALKQARELFVRTNFAGCAAVLAIAERELGANLSGVSAEVTARAHKLLAEVNLWLGVCRSLAGDAAGAASAFQRSARLPSSPVPDAGDLPPAVVRAYRRAVKASGPARRCGDEVSGDGGSSLLVDGRVVERTVPLELAEGGHYLAWGGCIGGKAGCRARLPDGRACAGSVRIEVNKRGCRVTVSEPAEDAALCLSGEEARDPGFASEVIEQADAPLYVVAHAADNTFTLRLLRRGDPSFFRRVSGERDAGLSTAQALGQALGAALEIGGATALPMRQAETPFYRKWWFWGLVGVAAGAASTLAIVAAAN